MIQNLVGNPICRFVLGRQACANVNAFAVGLILTSAQKSSAEFVKYFLGFRTKVVEKFGLMIEEETKTDRPQIMQITQSHLRKVKVQILVRKESV